MPDTYRVFAAPVRVPAEYRDGMIGSSFKSAAEALALATHLRRAGWFVYRVSGPHGFELSEERIDQYANAPHRHEE